MNQTIRYGYVKVREDRQCFSCLRFFFKGMKMFNWVGIWEGSMCSSYMCETCRKIADISEVEEDGYPKGYVKEMLEKDQTPEILLIQLTNSKK